MLNWFLNGVGESSACTGSSMSWPCIAVPQGSALDPTKLAHLCQEVNLMSALANPFILPSWRCLGAKRDQTSGPTYTLKLFQRPWGKTSSHGCRRCCCVHQLDSITPPQEVLHSCRRFWPTDGARGARPGENPKYHSVGYLQLLGSSRSLGLTQF